MGETVQIEPDWDLAEQPALEYGVYQRISCGGAFSQRTGSTGGESRVCTAFERLFLGVILRLVGLNFLSVYLTRCFSSLRAKVRRCMPKRRAASEMLKSAAAMAS